MITREDIEKLAELSRIKIEPKEQESLRAEIDAILGYIDQIKKASATATVEGQDGDPKNVMREDNNPHESGVFTEKILSGAPSRGGDYLKVKKIL